MATTAKKASSSADHDKDLQTLMELQEKLGRTAGLHQMVGVLCWLHTHMYQQADAAVVAHHRVTPYKPPALSP